MSHSWLHCHKTLPAIQLSSLKYSWNKLQGSICLKKYWSKHLKQITQGSLSVFIYFITSKSTPRGKKKSTGTKTFACSLTTLNGISSFPYKQKLGQFTVHTTRACTSQLLQCACATISIAELKPTCSEHILNFQGLSYEENTKPGTRTQDKQ